jgi:hypothetical protein
MSRASSPWRKQPWYEKTGFRPSRQARKEGHGDARNGAKSAKKCNFKFHGKPQRAQRRAKSNFHAKAQRTQRETTPVNFLANGQREPFQFLGLNKPEIETCFYKQFLASVAAWRENMILTQLGNRIIAWTPLLSRVH